MKLVGCDPPENRLALSIAGGEEDLYWTASFAANAARFTSDTGGLTDAGGGGYAAFEEAACCCDGGG